MALRNGKALTIRPKGLSDAVDGTNTFPGAMQMLANLVPAPGTQGLFIPRAAAAQVTDFTGLISPGAVSALCIIGSRVYGMIASGLTAGYDQPFVYDLLTGAFVAISGITAMNVPLTQSPVGAWQPPVIAAITATKIIVTHPGFSGTGTNFFGVIDITTFGSPAWSSSNTATHALPSVPQCVTAFNGRAYYAVKNSLVFSDALDPLTVTNASQVLVLGDNQNITALCGLPLTNQLVGGTVQSIIVFKSDEFMYQITGDTATSNLAVNEMNVQTGTLAPNTVVPTPYGVFFVAPDGLRPISLQGIIGDPIGAKGGGVNLPFINAQTPSRMCAAFNENTLRITVQNGTVSSNPYQEFWFDFTQKIWTGPHTSAATLIANSHIGSSTFVSALVGTTAKLFGSRVVSQAGASYTENAVALIWGYQTALLPDNGEMAMNKIVQTALALQLPISSTVTVEAIDEVGTILDTVTITATNVASTIWGAFTWGAAVWGAATGYFKQYFVPWAKPLVFKQASVLVTGVSQAGGAIGNLYMRYQILGYLLPY